MSGFCYHDSQSSVSARPKQIAKRYHQSCLETPEQRNRKKANKTVVNSKEALIAAKKIGRVELSKWDGRAKPAARTDQTSKQCASERRQHMQCRQQQREREGLVVAIVNPFVEEHHAKGAAEPKQQRSQGVALQASRPI